MKVKEFCDVHRIKLYFVVPPNKATVYPEYYPSFIKWLDKPGYYTLLTNYLNDSFGATFIDVYANVMKEKDNYTLYYKEDTHRNSVGAYFAYKKLGKAIAKDYPNFAVINQEDLQRCDAKNRGHDLVNMLGGYAHDFGLSPEFCLTKPIAINYIQRYSPPSQTIGHLKTDNIKEPKAMLIHDSFMEGMVNYISNGVSESMNAWGTGVSPMAYENEILEYKPDIIIWEMLERAPSTCIQAILNTKNLDKPVVRRPYQSKTVLSEICY